MTPCSPWKRSPCTSPVQPRAVRSVAGSWIWPTGDPPPRWRAVRQSQELTAQTPVHRRMISSVERSRPSARSRMDARQTVGMRKPRRLCIRNLRSRQALRKPAQQDGQDQDGPETIPALSRPRPAARDVAVGGIHGASAPPVVTCGTRRRAARAAGSTFQDIPAPRGGSSSSGVLSEKAHADLRRKAKGRSDRRALNEHTHWRATRIRRPFRRGPCVRWPRAWICHGTGRSQTGNQRGSIAMSAGIDRAGSGPPRMISSARCAPDGPCGACQPTWTRFRRLPNAESTAPRASANLHAIGLLLPPPCALPPPCPLPPPPAPSCDPACPACRASAAMRACASACSCRAARRATRSAAARVTGLRLTLRELTANIVTHPADLAKGAGRRTVRPLPRPPPAWGDPISGTTGHPLQPGRGQNTRHPRHHT